MNTNKNSYTIIYIIVIIVIVSLLLSIVSGLLRTRQDDNVRLDTKKQILQALPAVTLEGNDAAELYAQTITGYIILDKDGNVVKELDPVADFDYQLNDGEKRVYIATVDGQTKYILRLDGAGLWDAIWGYVALNDDFNTIYGVYYGHKGETPGLGAKIADKDFRDKFIGKEICKEGEVRSVAVLKKGQTAEGQDVVDAISGATVTSTAVQTMLANELKQYKGYILKNIVGVAEEAEPVAEEVEQVNEEQTAEEE